MTSEMLKPVVSGSSNARGSSSASTTTKTSWPTSLKRPGSSRSTSSQENGASRATLTNVSANGASTGSGTATDGHAGSSRTAHTNGNSPVSSPLMIDPTALTPPALWTLIECVSWICDGYSEREVALMHGESVKWVRHRIGALRSELEQQ